MFELSVPDLYWHFRLYCMKKKFQRQNATPVRIEPRPLTASDSKSDTLLPSCTNSTFACKTETLVSLYSHALLIPLKSSKSKYQVVHEQKFKDLLSSTFQVGVERRVSGLKSPLGVTFNHWILAFLRICEKPKMVVRHFTFL